MATTEGDGILELTVIRAEGLHHHLFHGYYVECIIGSKIKKTRTVMRSKNASAVEWAQTLPFAVDDFDASKLFIQVYLKNIFMKDNIEGVADIEISELQAGEVDVCLSLGSQSMKAVPSDRSIMIRCERLPRRDAVASAVDAAKEAMHLLAVEPVGLHKFNAAASAEEPTKSVVESWDSLIGKLETFNKMVSELSEIHPYVKAVLSVVKLISEAVKAQLKRDQKIMDLIYTMDDTFALINEGDLLNKKEPYKRLLKMLALQTVECGYFIQDYIKPNFFERMAESLKSGTDKVLNDLKMKFMYLRDCLRTHAIVDTTVQVYRIMDAVDNINETINLDHMTYADGMRFNTDSGCYRGTRKDILDNIVEWASNPDAERVLLLTGLAGSGKSAIAHSVSTRFNELQRLGSSFFCSRSKTKDSKPEQVFINIARDIADQIDQVRVHLAAKTGNRSLSSTQSITEQFNIFIKDAFVGLNMMGPLVIVIDALDECEGSDESRRTLMNILAKDTSSLPNKLRIFLTARSGDRFVESAFGSAGDVRRVRLEDADRSATSNDVYIFIGEKLKDIANDLREKHPKWQEELTGQSGGIFIWAATACKYILGEDAGGLDLNERYDEVRKLRRYGESTEGMEPVYILYSTILRTAFKRKSAVVMERLKKVLGIIITASTPLSTLAIEELSGVGNVIISRLGALLIGWNDPTLPAQVLHASFSDYLADKEYSGDFHIDDKYRHVQMALLCLELMDRKLKVNICEFEDYHVLYEDIQRGELDERRKKHISEALRYACRHWATHVVQIDYGSIKESLHHFLFERKHLIHWVEVMSILQSTDVAKKSMHALFEWIKCNMEDEPTTHRLIYDCCRFLDGFSYPITLGPLHMYLSALPYVPTKTALYCLYSHTSGLEPIVIFQPKQNSNWSLRRSQLLMNDEVAASAFSEDGTLVACMAKSGMVQVFDFETSSPLGNAMELNVESNAAVAIFLDDYKVAISYPGGIAVWNRKDGTCIHLEDSIVAEERIPVVFQSNDVVVACRPNGTKVEIWKSGLDSKKTCINAFEAVDRVEQVALSPNGVYAGGVTIKRSVFVWNVDTEEEIARFRVPGDGEITALGVSSSGSYVVIRYGLWMAIWSKDARSVIWDNHSWDKREILLPLATDCDHFITRGEGNCVWNMASGDWYYHESGLDDALAISSNGQYFITKSAAIYRVNADKDEPTWELSNDTEANKLKLEEDERLTHVVISPGGTVIAAGGKDKTVFVRDRLGEADATKQSMEAHAYVCDVRISWDGLKLASRDSDDNVLVWTRATVGANFEQFEELKFENQDAAKGFINEPSQWGGTESTSGAARNSFLASQTESLDYNVKSKAVEQSTESSFLAYIHRSEWVTVMGKKLWWIPEGFRSWDTISSQSSRQLVLYDSNVGVIFKYINDVHT